MGKLVLGIGVNDAGYTVKPTIGGRRTVCPIYHSWKNMLERCYSATYQGRYPTYIDCSVVEEWHSFSTFKKWMDTQDWKGKQLDKDILVEGNKVYGPDACVFVDSKTNKLLTDSGAARGDLPIGVTRSGEGYQAQCRKDGRLIYLGTYQHSRKAHDVYRRFKAVVIIEAALRQSDRRVFMALLKRAAALRPNMEKA